MPELIIDIEGDRQQYALDDFKNRHLIEMPHSVPIRAQTLDHGMQSGAPSIGFILELPAQEVIIVAETSVKLFQLACYATLARYGDLTSGAVTGLMDKKKAHLTFSSAARCPSCNREIASSCKFCPECGSKL